MPDILAPGQWETLSLVDSGAVQLSLVSATAARLELSGTASAPKYLGSARDVVAFPVSAVGDGTPVTVDMGRILLGQLVYPHGFTLLVHAG